MFACAAKFESYQSQWFFSRYTDSGFSGEDLTSDLLVSTEWYIQVIIKND